MALVAVLTGDPNVRLAVKGPLTETDAVAATRSWDRLTWLLRERPATAVVVDSEALHDPLTQYQALSELRRQFPSLSMLFMVRPGTDPVSLFRLGRAGLRSLVLIPLEAAAADVRGALRRALRTGTGALVTRAVSPFVPVREAIVVRTALEGAIRGWDTEEVSERLGVTRPHLSVRLRKVGLPPAGSLLMWAKMLHAARWLTDPGRTAESVSRQLDYSSGAAFRRALRSCVGATPTEVISRGGLRYVLGRFLDECALGGSVVFTRSVA
jgi:AraC-like DNA-binding protein